MDIKNAANNKLLTTSIIGALFISILMLWCLGMTEDACAAVAGQTVEINTGYVNVRSGPDTTYDVLGSLSLGDQVQVTGSQDGWYIIDYNGQKAYIFAEYASDVAGVTQQNLGSVTANLLNVRSEMDKKKSDIVATLRHGDLVEITNKADDWYEIKYNGSEKGYVVADYIFAGNGKSTAVVQVDKLAVRIGADVSYKSDAVAKRGQILDVLAEKNGWYQVSFEGFTYGYVDASYVALVQSANIEKKADDEQEKEKQEEETDDTDWDAMVTAHGIVNTDDLSIRTGPGTDYDRVGYLSAGTEVAIIEDVGGWYKISYDGKAYYVSSEYIDQPDEEDKDKEKDQESSMEGQVVAITDVNIRSGSSTETDKLGILPAGAQATYLDDEGGWYHISYNGVEGYVYSEYVTYQVSLNGDGSVSE